MAHDDGAGAGSILLAFLLDLLAVRGGKTLLDILDGSIAACAQIVNALDDALIEILLQAKAMGGTSADSKIIAYRLLKNK